MKVHSGTGFSSLQEAVFFPFDDHSIPFSTGLRLFLTPGKSADQVNPTVISTGPEGAPDEETVRFYGTVIPVDGELRMWYLARGYQDNEIFAPNALSWDPEVGWITGAKGLRACYATSTDGIHWKKPNLGLVEYNGNKDNNIVDLSGGRCDLASLPVPHDPDDPDPDRRFKVAYESLPHGARAAAAYSPDGLRWTECASNPVTTLMEQTGLIRFNGCYYMNGQAGGHFGVGRKLQTFASYDFEHWTESSCMGFRRDNIPPRPMAGHWNTAEEVHLGAGLWNRGNVVIGIYDMWHGSSTGDRSQVTMDLGMVVSNDALHFREPIADFRFVPAYEEVGVPIGRGPALSHGQGMFNIGDHTMLCYECWPGGGIRLSRWQRDRIGGFRFFGSGTEDFAAGAEDSQQRHCIACAVDPQGANAQIFVNADGLNEHSELTVELLDEQFHPLAGYSGDACIPLDTPGLRQQVCWKDRDQVAADGPIRLRANFGGLRPEDVRLYAMYLSTD